MRRANLTPNQVIDVALDITLKEKKNDLVAKWLQDGSRIATLEAKTLASCTSEDDIKDLIDRSLRSNISQDQVNQAFFGILAIDSPIKAYNVMKCLLYYLNADVNFSFQGNTPLHIATINNWPRVVQLLLEFGADKTRTNTQGYTAPEIAKYNNMKEVGSVLGLQSHEYHNGKGSSSTFHGAMLSALVARFKG